MFPVTDDTFKCPDGCKSRDNPEPGCDAWYAHLTLGQKMHPHLEVVPQLPRESLDAPVLQPVTVVRSRSLFFGYPVEWIEVRGGRCTGKSVIADALGAHLGQKGYCVVVFDTLAKAWEANAANWNGRNINTVIVCIDQ